MIASENEVTVKRGGNKPEKIRGIVKWFHYRKGFGFLERADGGEDVFVHRSAIQRPNGRHLMASLDEGEPVEFTLGQFHGAVEAVNVTGPNGRRVAGSRYAAFFYPHGYYEDYYDQPYTYPSQYYPLKSKKRSDGKAKDTDGSEMNSNRVRVDSDQIAKGKKDMKNVDVSHTSYDFYHGYAGLHRPISINEKKAGKRRALPRGRRHFAVNYFDPHQQYFYYYYPPKGVRKTKSKAEKERKVEEHETTDPMRVEAIDKVNAHDVPAVRKGPARRRRHFQQQQREKTVEGHENQSEIREQLSEQEGQGEETKKRPPQRRRFRRRKEKKDSRLAEEKEQPINNGNTTDSGVSSPQPPGEVDKTAKIVSTAVTIQLSGNVVAASN